MPALCYVNILVLVVMANCEYVHGLHTNPPVENGGTAAVVVPENAANVTVFCEVTFGNGAPRVSTWFLTPKNGARERVSADLDMATLECNNTIPPPDTQTVVSSYQWFTYINGVAINSTTSTNPNVSVYPNIVFTSVVRTQSGNYSMTANTSFGGEITGYFNLSVHLVDVSSTQMYYGVESGSVTLVAHVNITGNPVPGSVWMFNGASARGDAVISGQLTITNPTPADSGNYTKTLTNTLNDGNTSSISNTIGLQVLMLLPPTSPDTTNTGSMSSATPVNTGSTQPPSSLAPVNAGIIACAVVAMIAIVLIILIVLLLIGFRI